ncbi:MAG: hypothetical protein V1750_07410 [Acidobacteriota bacterium]
MLENLTERARRALFFARFEAARASSAVEAADGARPLRRAVQRFLEDAISDYLIQHRETAEKELVARLAGETVVVAAREGVWG